MKWLVILIAIVSVGCAPRIEQRPIDIEALKVSKQVLSEGHAQFKRKNFKGAEIQYHLAVELGLSGEGYDALGCVAYARGDRAAATRYFQQAIAEAPGYAPTYGHVAQLLEDQGALAQAEAHYQKGISLKPSDVELRYAYAQFLARHGKKEDAAVLLAQIRSMLPRRLPMDPLQLLAR